MRTVTTSVDVYTFAELTEEAQSVAVDRLREKLSGDWWDSHDTEQLEEAMVSTLAHTFRSPGWDTEGADITIDHVTVNAWDLDRGSYLALSGYLDRDNAPALPWVDGIDQVELSAERWGTTVDVIDSVPGCICSADTYLQTHQADCPQVAESPVTDEQRAALEQAVTEAISEALRAGSDELEYKTSDEYARNMTDGQEFTADGHLY